MAKEETEEQEKENENVEKKSSSSTLKIILISVSLAIILGGGLVGGTFYFVSSMNTAQATSSGTSSEKAEADEDENEDEVADSEPAEPPQYHSMDPKFVVSFNDQSKARFMQFSLEIMSRDKEIVTQMEMHMPVIRSSLLMLYSDQAYEEMMTRGGKEKLLMDTTADINTVLQKISGEDEDTSIVEAAYFNSFVIQ